MKRPYRGVWKEGFDQIFCDNFVIILIKGKVDKPIFFVYVVVQFYPWFNFYFPLFWGMVIYDNEFETKGNKN